MASNYQRQTSSHSAGDIITAAHLDDEFDYLYATVLNGGASTGIGTNDLMNDAVNGTKIADDAIDSEHYVDGSIDTAHLADDAVDADKLASDAVVDASIAKSGAFSIFGSWTTTDSLSADLEEDSIYQAQTDGFVTAYQTSSSSIFGYSDSNASPTTIVAHDRDAAGTGINFPVKKNDYWKVTSDGTLTEIRWLPIGTGGCVKQ